MEAGTLSVESAGSTMGLYKTQPEATARAAVAAELFRYPDADHGFHCDARGSYHEKPARDAWWRTVQWLGTHWLGTHLERS